MSDFLGVKLLRIAVNQSLTWCGSNAVLMQISGSEIVEATKIVCQAIVTVATLYFSYLQYRASRGKPPK